MDEKQDYLNLLFFLIIILIVLFLFICSIFELFYNRWFRFWYCEWKWWILIEEKCVNQKYIL